MTKNVSTSTAGDAGEEYVSSLVPTTAQYMILRDQHMNNCLCDHLDLCAASSVEDFSKTNRQRVETSQQSRRFRDSCPVFQCFSVSVAAEQGKVFPQGLSDTTSCFCNFILAKSQPLTSSSNF